MQSVGIPASGHDPSGKAVHDQHFVVFYNIVHLVFHDAPGTDGLVHMVGNCGVFRIGKVLDIEEFLGFFGAGGGKHH